MYSFDKYKYKICIIIVNLNIYIESFIANFITTFFIFIFHLNSIKILTLK